MPFDLQTAIAGHHSFFHGRVALTHRPKNPPGPDASTGVYGLRGAVTKERLAQFGTVSAENVTCIWEVWGTTAAVNNGDHLVDPDGVLYCVIDRFYSKLTSRYECACQQIKGTL